VITIVYCLGCVPHVEAASRGCCSYHGGVSGCAGSRLMCVDGSESVGCGCGQVAITPQVSAVKPHAPNPVRAEKAVNQAVSLLGTPYVLGGSDSQGTDCSGLVQQAVPDYFPRRMTAADQLGYLESKGDENVPAKELQPGDLVYFRDASGAVAHAAVVERENSSAQRPTGIIAASSNVEHVSVVRETLGKDGSLGEGLRYAGGGRPR